MNDINRRAQPFAVTCAAFSGKNAGAAALRGSALELYGSADGNRDLVAL